MFTGNGDSLDIIAALFCLLSVKAGIISFAPFCRELAQKIPLFLRILYA